MSQTVRWTSADLEAFPDDDGKRYEIIGGKLYVSKAPGWKHQLVCIGLGGDLDRWSRASGLGVLNVGPGIIFADDDDVIPDLVWISHERLAAALWTDQKLHLAPELVIEVLSPGRSNAQRDRQAKLGLYGRRGVDEYWIVDWERRQVEVYRRSDTTLRALATLHEGDLLESPLLPGFSLPLSDLFARLQVP
jgi:Uma2 family endonuclease